tara:strand:+ start:509 stop:799 length:291 start_codon:yes stop_codon:yes gene_type:complete
MNIADVIGWKFNHQEGMTTKDNKITEFPDGIPTQAEQDSWTSEYQTHLASVQYQANRSLEYPSIQDQLDMQYWDSVNGTTTWATAIAKVKTDNPKP